PAGGTPATRHRPGVEQRLGERRGDARSRADPALQVALGDELLESGDDRVARAPRLLRQCPRRGKPGAGPEPPAQDGLADALVDLAVARDRRCGVDPQRQQRHRHRALHGGARDQKAGCGAARVRTWTTVNAQRTSTLAMATKIARGSPWSRSQPNRSGPVDEPTSSPE